MPFALKDEVICVNNGHLAGNDVKPPLHLNEEYTVKGIALDTAGNQHLDVGLHSEYNYITSHETGEVLPNSEIHWCHPSRFQLITNKQKQMFFRHKKTGAVISHDCYNKVPKRTPGTPPRFESMEEATPTHRYDERVTKKDDDDDDSFLTGALVGLVAAEVAEAVFDNSQSDFSTPDNTPDFGGFGGGDSGGGGAGGDF